MPVWRTTENIDSGAEKRICCGHGAAVDMEEIKVELERAKGCYLNKVGNKMPKLIGSTCGSNPLFLRWLSWLVPAIR
jgi:hypothetical protein